MNRYQRRGVLLLQAEKTARGPALCTFTAPEVSHSDVAVSHLVSLPSSFTVSHLIRTRRLRRLLKSRSSSPLPSSRIISQRERPGAVLSFESQGASRRKSTPIRAPNLPRRPIQTARLITVSLSSRFSFFQLTFLLSQGKFVLPH